MVRFAKSAVEVIAPDGIKSHWVVALPHSAAVAAVRRVIPSDHTAELSIRRFTSEGLHPGEVREIEPMTDPKRASDPNQTVESVIDIPTAEPRVSGRTLFEYRAYAVGSDGRFLRCDEMICRDDREAVAKAKQLINGSDIEVWNHNRFIARLAHTPK